MTDSIFFPDNSIETCSFLHVHESKVQQVRQMMPNEGMLNQLSEFFKVFGDNTRIRILYVLFEEEVCVCDLAQIIGMTQSAVSHQLRILKQASLIKSRREGKTIFYSLADEHVSTLLRMATEHLEEN